MQSRNRTIYLRLTEEEKLKVEGIARSKKISLSSLCRDIILNAIEVESPEESLDDTEIRDIHIRISSKKLKEIDDTARKNFMSRNSYITKAVFENTVVFDGLKQFTKEINMLGSNINQIVILAHQGVMKTVDFGKFNELMGKVISYLIEIKKGQENNAYYRKGGRTKESRR